MRQFSIEAVAAHAVAFPDPLILLDKGLNVFQVVTEDIDGVLQLLKAEDVTIRAVRPLVHDDPPSLEDELLPGESLGLLT